MKGKHHLIENQSRVFDEIIQIIVYLFVQYNNNEINLNNTTVRFHK